MKGRWVMMIVLLAALLAGCGGEEGPATSPPTEQTGAATPLPTEPPAPEGPTATVVDVVNEVDAHALPEAEWVEAVADMTIYLGGEVWAKEASTARVGLEEGMVRVAPNTIFTFAQPDPDTVRLTMQEGQVWVNVEGLRPGETFEVETPAAVASVRGTRFSVRTTPDGGTTVSVLEGTVTVSAAGVEVEVKAGQEVAVPPGGPPGDPGPMSIPEQLRWGMAADTYLNPVLPVFGEPEWITQTGHASHPHCSPDGRYLTYFNYRENTAKGYMIYDREANTFVEGILPEEAWGMSFHPSGDRIAYNTDNEIGVVGLDGSLLSYFTVPGATFYFPPHWSPDGEWLLFQALVGAPSRSHVFKARPDGSDLVQLTSGEGEFAQPVWSPDGDSIAYFRSEENSKAAELWIVSPDGVPRTVITDTAFLSWVEPAWSPDGSTIAVAGYGEGEYGRGGGLWLVPLDDGGIPRIITGTEGLTSVDLTWYPDGGLPPDLWILPEGAEPPEGTGWPLFFKMYDEESTGIWWYAPGLTEGATFYADAYWGPVGCPDGEEVLFGYVEGEGEERTTTIYSFPMLPMSSP
ncbi:MAG TPA: hypothetical protein ENK08_01355 [Chloroflexi bacterium]|nr:hypothetical protein [Chloroflexota bacterium]